MSGTTSRDISGEKEHLQPVSQQTRAYGPEYHNAAMSQNRPSEASNDQPERRRPPIQHTTSPPLPSAMKKKDKPKTEKSVTWSPDIIDNEKLPRGQSGSSVPIQFPWQTPSPPTNPTSQQVVHAANTLARANSPAQNQDSVTRFRELGFVPNKSPANPGTSSQNLPKQDKSSSGYVSRVRANTFSTRVDPSAVATQPSPSVELQQAKKLAKQRPSANTGKKRDPERLDIVVTIESRPTVRRKRPSSVPPPVPEPPTMQRQVPPPTPRISRLPSPDLPDIDGGTFCTCSPPCTSKYDHEGKPLATKMNEQLEAAKKYIKKHKGNKN